MTRPDEIAALADDFACKINSTLVYEGFTFNAPFTPKLLVVLTRTVREEVTPLFDRLAATSPGDAVREALLAIQQHVEDIRERAFSAGDLPKALGDIHTAGGNIVEEIDNAIAALTAPAAKAPAVSEADVGRVIDNCLVRYAPNCSDLLARQIDMAREDIKEAVLDLFQSAAPGGGTEGARECVCQDQHRRGYCTEPNCSYHIGPSDPAQEPEAVAWRWQEPGWGDHWVYNPDPSWLEQQNDIVKQPLYTRPVSLDWEAVKEELRQWHRDTCYPDASQSELAIGLNRILALIEGRT